MNRIKLAKEIHTNAVEKGFWETEEFIKKAALIVTELGEAIEADRKDKWADRDTFYHEQKLAEKEGKKEELFTVHFQQYIKDTVEDELADVWIRCLDWLYHRHGGYIGFPSDLTYVFEGHFAEDVFKLMQRVCNLEIKETVILIENLCKVYEVDLQWHVEKKMKYNSTRPYLHNNKY